MNNKPRLCVLIVDDDFVARLIHRKIVESLTDFNASSIEAGNGVEALITIINSYSKDRSIPDLILLDTFMPEMDGFVFIKELRTLEFAKDIPIIIVSVSEDVSDKQKARSMGVNYFFTKPITTILLKSTIIDCIGYLTEGENNLMYVSDIPHRLFLN